jgi:hypothetical protein
LVSPEGSLARALELNLLKDDQEERLDGALFEAVVHRLRAASEYHEQVLRIRARHVEGLLASWAKD